MKLQLGIDIALGVLTTNLDDHLRELAEAKEGWIEKVKAELDKLRDAVNRKGLDASNHALSLLFHSCPRDNRKEYSKFIGALERAKASGQTHVEIDEDDYDQMFNDNWDWRRASKTTNSTYLKSSMP